MTDSNPDKKRCGAKTRAGTPCKLYPMPNGRCKLHGGKSLGGIFSPRWKTGKYSKYLPQKLAERYGEALADPDLLSMSQELALIDARIVELMGRIETGESRSLFFDLQDALKQFQVASAKNDTSAARDSLNVMANLIRRGAEDYRVWGEISLTIEQRRRLAETERRRLVELKQMITVEDALNYAKALATAVKESVTDPEVISKINARFTRLTRGGNFVEGAE